MIFTGSNSFKIKSSVRRFGLPARTSGTTLSEISIASKPRRRDSE